MADKKEVAFESIMVCCLWSNNLAMFCEVDRRDAGPTGQYMNKEFDGVDIYLLSN